MWGGGGAFDIVSPRPPPPGFAPMLTAIFAIGNGTWVSYGQGRPYIGRSPRTLLRTTRKYQTRGSDAPPHPAKIALHVVASKIE